MNPLPVFWQPELRVEIEAHLKLMREFIEQSRPQMANRTNLFQPDQQHEATKLQCLPVAGLKH